MYDRVLYHKRSAQSFLHFNPKKRRKYQLRITALKQSPSNNESKIPTFELFYIFLFK